MKHNCTSILTLSALFLAFLFPDNARAQFNRLFTSDQELPSSLVNEVVEDTNQMIWIATEDGLCRFDGSGMSTYRNIPGDSCSLQSNYVRTLCADAEGHVLVGTLEGVQMYRPLSDDFTPPIINPAAGIPAHMSISDLCCLQNGDFVVAGNSTYSIHLDDQGQPHAVANAFTRQVGMTHRVTQDLQGNVWVCNVNDEVYCLSPLGALSVKRLPMGSFVALGKGPDGGLYASCESRGVYRYNSERDSFDEVTRPDQDFVVRDFSIVPDTRQMYLGTDGQGVMLLDCTTGQISPYVFDDQRVDAATQKVHSINVSSSGDTWMCLYQRGVFVVGRNPLNFHYFGANSVRYNCIGTHCVTSLLRTHDGGIWVATDNGGLYNIDQQGHTLAHYPPTSSPHSVPSSFMKLFEDSRHRVWFGSYRQGGGILNLQTGACQYVPVEGQSDAFANIYDFVEDKRGQIWVASMGQGLLRYDEARRRFVRVPIDNSVLWCGALCYDPKADVLYLGTYSGLRAVALRGDELFVIGELPGYVVFSIVQCSATTLALCTNLGLVLYDGATHQHRLYTTDDGLPNDNVYAAQTDGMGSLWVSSSTGLSKMNMLQGTFTNYTIRDGLQGNEFYKNASMRDDDGTLWFGGTNGITWFHPQEILLPAPDIDVRIVGCRADQNVILPDANGGYRISEQDHSFTLELATLPIMLTGRVQYHYSFDGDTWQTLPPMLNRVSFSHIASGSHEFLYQAVGEVTSSPVKKASIFIAHPWYRKPWAVALWLSILALIGYLAYLLVRRRREAKLLKQRRQQDEAINEARMQLFMNIAHEFRTPMTLIVSPLHQLMTTDKEATRQHSYQLMDRNASRILNLTSQLMDLRKVDKGQMRLACRLLELSPYVHSLVEAFADIAQMRHIDVSVLDQLPVGFRSWFDADCIEKMLSNLLSNAFKYTPDGGSVQVAMRLVPEASDSVSNTASAKQVELAVTDTGIGIPEADRARIFERFYRVQHAGQHSVGTGIGLNLVHLLVRLHHGTITVTDNPNTRGTRFTIAIPLDASLYGAGELIHDAEAEPAAQAFTHGLSASSIASSELRTGSTTAADAADHTAAPRLRVMVVEDDNELREYLRQELSIHYAVTTCSDGAAAYEQLLRQDHDLVLSDVMMPVMDGVELSQKVRRNVRLNHLPIVLLTAKATEEDRLRSLDIGVNAFIAKPFNIEILLRTVKNLLESQSRLRNRYSGQQLPADQVETPDVKSPDERLLERIVRVINDNLSNPDLTAEFIAEQVGLSRVHLYRKLKELTNQSARNYIRNIRLAKAADLLAQKKMAVAEVAYQVGFTSPNNFATAFKELYGETPTDYMARHQDSPC